MPLRDPLLADRDFGHFKKGITYRCVFNDAMSNRVLMTWHPSETKAGTALIVSTRTSFENALEQGALVRSNDSSRFPPWLAVLNGKNLADFEESRTGKRVRSNLDTCRDRDDLVAAVLGEMKIELLRADDPIAALRKQIREHEHKTNLNVSRTLDWILLRLSYNSRDALYPATAGNGRWDRGERPCDVSRFERGEYYRLDAEAAKQCVRGFRRQVGKGRFLVRIHRRVLRTEFGCKVRRVNAGLSCVIEIYHPKGLPYPSYEQFRYHVGKEIGLEDVQLAIYGAKRVRNRRRASEGSYSESVSDYLQKVEIDAQAWNVTPAEDIQGVPPPKMHEYHAVDVATGAGVGIAFTEGGETAEGYNCTMFSMAIGLGKTCELFGVPYNPDDIPPAGVCDWMISDRGSGAGLQAIARTAKARELAPVKQGQAKAAVETSHDKPMKMDSGALSERVKSRLSIAALVRRKVAKFVATNRSKDVIHRLTDSMLDNHVAGNPVSMARWLESRGRTQGGGMEFNDAVRMYLPKHNFSVGKSGLYLHGQRFCSEALQRTGALEKLAEGTKLVGYVFSMATRYVWVEYESELLELEAIYPLRTPEGLKYVPLKVLEDRAALRVALRKEQQRTAAASELLYEELDEQMIGRMLSPARHGSKGPRAKAA